MQLHAQPQAAVLDLGARRLDAPRRWRAEACAKVHERRWDDLTPEEVGWILSRLQLDTLDA